MALSAQSAVLFAHLNFCLEGNKKESPDDVTGRLSLFIVGLNWLSRKKYLSVKVVRGSYPKHL